jgi:hypothetical protein
MTQDVAACEICGAAPPPDETLRYRRVAAGPTEPLETRTLRECAECHRKACPNCLRVYEDRADDFFFDMPVCISCGKRASPP